MPFAIAAELHGALGDIVGERVDARLNLIEQLVQGDEGRPLHIPMRLLDRKREGRSVSAKRAFKSAIMALRVLSGRSLRVVGMGAHSKRRLDVARTQAPPATHPAIEECPLIRLAARPWSKRRQPIDHAAASFASGASCCVQWPIFGMMCDAAQIGRIGVSHPRFDRGDIAAAEHLQHQIAVRRR